jgi:hypothetical protein
MNIFVLGMLAFLGSSMLHAEWICTAQRYSGPKYSKPHGTKYVIKGRDKKKASEQALQACRSSSPCNNPSSKSNKAIFACSVTCKEVNEF